MTDVQVSLSSFDARLRPGTALRWPLGQRLGPDEAIELVPAATDLLILGYTAARKLDTREPVHESLMIELSRALADSRPGPLPLGRVVFRIGTERLTYQATRVTGTIGLVASGPDRFVLSAILNLHTPELDLDGIGPRTLSGTVRLPRSHAVAASR